MLNDFKIKQLKPKEKIYRVADHSGLCIEIRPTGAKFWRYRYRYLNNAKMLTIGQYPEICLAYARSKTMEYREKLAKGTDPIQFQKEERTAAIQSNADSFKNVAEEYLEKYKTGKSKDWFENRTRYFSKDIYPVIGKTPIKDVNSSDIRTIIDNAITRIRKSRRGTGEVKATLVRQICAEVLQYGIITQRITTDPTYALRRYIHRPDVQHAQPLSDEDKKIIIPTIKSYGGCTSTKNSILTLLYSMLRTIEVRRAKKTFINFEDETWTIPIATNEEILAGKRNMKKNRIHIIPLSTQLIDLLKEQFSLYPDSEYIFPGDDGISMIGKNTLNSALDNLGIGHISMHHFRATASTELHEANFNTDWVEIQLAHAKVNKTRASYDHAKWLKDRKAMLQTWANMIDNWEN